MTRLEAIGYWYSDAERSLPRVEDLVDDSWDSDERDFVLDYLEHGFAVTASLGTSRCRVCGMPMGATDITDGVMIWPEGLVHYVREHAVRVPTQFVDQMRRRLAQLELTPVDRSAWESYASGRR